MRCAAFALGLFVGCQAPPAEVPFVSSSLDATRGAPQTALIRGSGADDVANRLVELAQARGLFAIARECVGPYCHLVFVDGEEPRVASERAESEAYGRLRATQPGAQQHVRVEKAPSRVRQSKIFVRIAETEEGAYVFALGVPILGGEQACPAYVAHYFEACSAPLMMTEGGTPLADTVRRREGHDVSGAVEAELIRGLFSELGRRPSW